MATLLLIVILAVCVVTDIRSRKIYNAVLFPALGAAFLISSVTDGAAGFLDSLAGFGLGFAILLIPYFMGGMGAGDVKLLAVIGAVKGPVFVANTSIYMALAGGVMALFIMLFRRGAFRRLSAILYFFTARKSGVNMPLLLDKSNLSGTYPYGVAIAAGAVISLLWKEGMML
ncbi:A24 family peptidase [Bacillus marinisedimentorum]|uniref:A24 family peptidase n=1 Tax=Bacillus marinisedimentorum TaxID=1821260 RepID=UPI0008726EBE|nr:prepilin peptidase [Bacillus marinisedimentorum]